MDTPEQPNESDELLVPKQGGSTNRKSRKRRNRIEKEKMFAIELHRRTLRIRLMMALAVLLFAVFVTVVAAWYPGTEGFRKRLDQMILNSTGAEVNLENAALTPFGGSADRIVAKWPDGNFLKSIDAQGLVATVLPQRHFGRTYGGDEVSAVSGKLSLRYPDAEAMAVAAEGVAGKSRVHFNRIGIPKLEVQFGEAGTAKSARITETEAAFYPKGPGGVPRVLLYSGNLEIPSWPKLLIERAVIDFPEGRSRITGMRIRDGLFATKSDALAGSCEISGEISLDASEASTLQLVLDGFRLQSLIGDDASRVFLRRTDLSVMERAELGESVGRMFFGRVDTRVGEETGVIRISEEDGLQMRVELVASPMSELSFNHFPFIAFLSRAIDDRWFSNPMFEDAPSMVLIRDGGEMVFDEINFTARHRMAIRGSFSIDPDGMVAGGIEVGLAPTVIEAAAARRLDGMFSPERDDFRWIKLELGGTIRMPTDNFNAQFIDAPLPEIELPQIVTPPSPEPETESEPQRPTRERPPSVLPLLDLDE